MPPGRSSRLRLAARGDQAHDLVLQLLPVAGVVLVPDHQIDRQPLQPPVRVRLHQLAHQLDARRVGDLQQHDRQVAGDRRSPTGRTARAGCRAGSPGSARRRAFGVDDRGWPGARTAARRPRLALSWRSSTWLCVQARSNTRSARWRSRYLPISAGSPRASVGDAGDDVDGGRLLRLQRDAAADRDDRIEHRALRCWTAAPGRDRSACGAPSVRPRPMKRARSVSYEIVLDVGVVHGQQVAHPRRVLVGRARPARAQDRLQRGHQLGLHEQVAEGRMQRVGQRRRQHHLGVAGQLDRARAARLRLVMRVRRSSMSSSGDTTISVCVSNSRSRPRNSARASEKIAS